MDKWTLNEEQVLQMINTEPVEIEESNVSYDIRLPREERIERAKEILKKSNIRGE